MFKKLFPTALVNYAYNNTNYIFKRQAGHSKWANIKHTKALKDLQKARMFTKFGQQIKVAIQEGGSPNPAFNLRLEQVIAQAKRMNMPVASIESVIKSTQKDKSQAKSHTFEIRGPGRCIFLCEVFTTNYVKTKNDISTIMKKHFCKYSDGGGRHLFEHKGMIETEIPPHDKNSNQTILELATNHAIESGAEEVELLEDSNKLQFICDLQSFGIVQKKLEEFNYTIIQAGLEYIPTVRVPLHDEELEVCGNFIDKLDNMEEVVKVYDNIA